MINLTQEKCCKMMEFVIKASAAKRLSDTANIPLDEARKIVNAAVDKVGITALSSSLPSESEIPDGMIPVIEIPNRSGKPQISFIDGQSFIGGKNFGNENQIAI